MSGSVIHPGDLPPAAALVRDFVNTLDHELDTDELARPAGLTGFLATRGLLSGSERAEESHRATAVRLRGALHEALELNHDAVRAPLPDLDAVLAELPVRLSWTGDGVVARPAQDGVVGALSGVAVAAHECLAAQTWWRLKICAFDECEWAYYDQSKNRSRSYCEYGCGNKLKTRNYRARQRTAR